MSDYDYGNARLRAMKSRLLSARGLDALLEAGSVQALIVALTKTAYRDPVETALARASGLNCIDEALRNDLGNTLGKVRSFYTGQAGEMVAIVLRTYDIQNLKAILRGLAKQVAPGEIMFSMLPVGELKDSLLSALARAPAPRTVVDILASMNSPYALPLLHLQAEYPGVGTAEMEIALERWYFRDSFHYLKAKRLAGGVLYSALQLEADLINLSIVLRFAHSPGERKYLREWTGSEELDPLYVGRGVLSTEVLDHAGNQDSVEAAISVLSGTPYEFPLREGLIAYQQSGRLSEFERHLKRYRLGWMSKLIPRDSLGIGILLGYHALKSNEVRNVRWIAQGFNLGLRVESIRSELEYPQ